MRSSTKSAAQRSTLRRPAELIAAGLADPGALSSLEQVAGRYAVAITPAIARLIDAADPRDPIARQFVPSAAELETRVQERGDPVGDDAHSPVEGVVHRYPDRVLLKVVHVCPVYCRFCFRREMVGPGKRRAMSVAAVSNALDYISAHPDIWEVVLTGGDPLVLPPRRLSAIVRKLAAIDHVKIVRLHTRMPVAAPERITAELAQALRAGGVATYVALHANHAHELTPDARAACARLVDAGIPMLSQTVLLRGVNDDAATLEQLMRTFIECRIKPYYLHHADLAPGTAHLRTSIADGQALIRMLRGRASGLCQPTYVLDIPGGAGKSPIGPCYLSVESAEGGAPCYAVLDYKGGMHHYRDNTQ